MTYEVGYKDLKFLVDKLEVRGLKRGDIADWIRKHKRIVNPAFMKAIYSNLRESIDHIYQSIILSNNIKKLEAEGVEIAYIYQPKFS